MVTDALYTRLAADGTVAGLVGTRIRSSKLEQGDTLPAIVMHQYSTDHTTDFSGGTGWAHALVQVDCLDDDYNGADALFEAVRAELQGWQGTASSIVVNSCLLNNSVRMFEPSVVKADVGTHKVSMDFSVWYLE